METLENFEQHMAQIIWDNRWKNPHALQILSEHALSDQAQDRVLEILTETMQVRSFHFDQIGRDSLAAAGVTVEPQAVA